MGRQPDEAGEEARPDGLRSVRRRRPGSEPATHSEHEDGTPSPASASWPASSNSVPARQPPGCRVGPHRQRVAPMPPPRRRSSSPSCSDDEPATPLPRDPADPAPAAAHSDRLNSIRRRVFAGRGGRTAPSSTSVHMKIVAAGIAFGALTWSWMSCNAAGEEPSATLRFDEGSIALDDRHHESFDTRFTIDAISRYTVSLGTLLSYHLDVARYRDAEGVTRRAIVHLPDDGSEAGPVSGPDPYQFRREAWNELGRVVARHTDDRALFVGWWDNMQRLHLPYRTSRPPTVSGCGRVFATSAPGAVAQHRRQFHPRRLAVVREQAPAEGGWARRSPESPGAPGARRAAPCFCWSPPTTLRTFRRCPTSPDAAFLWRRACSRRKATSTA